MDLGAQETWGSMARGRSSRQQTIKAAAKVAQMTGYAVNLRRAIELTPWRTQSHQGVLPARTAVKSVQALSALDLTRDGRTKQLHNQLTSSPSSLH